MVLFTYKDGYSEYSYNLDEEGNTIYHGEYKRWWSCKKQLWVHTFYCHNELHGEYKSWDVGGGLSDHCFYIGGKRYPYVEMNEQEKLLFQIQHQGFRFL